ncbi:MAG TPA: hypothetical protein VLG46_06030 [Anaerolineae bacterium]|nr:hypothetical protein [Anaerolineae bacterium]
MLTIDRSALRRLIADLKQDYVEARAQLTALEHLAWECREVQVSGHHAGRQRSYGILRQAEPVLEWAYCPIPPDCVSYLHPHHTAHL